MHLGNRRSPRIAVTLVCACALISAYVFQGDVWRRSGSWFESMPEVFANRYQPLQTFVPSTDAMRFLADDSHIVNRIVPSDDRLRLAQLALSPRYVGVGVESPWVIVDSDFPEATPAAATGGGWQLVADLHNGVKLYRTDARK
jgi:hypothetical protein